VIRNLIFILCACLLLVGCAVYRPDIQQGNIYTPRMINRLHRGMTPFEVKHIMGNPVLENTFADQRMNYVYTFKPGKGKMTQKRVTLTFKRNRLVAIQKG